MGWKEQKQALQDMFNRSSLEGCRAEVRVVPDAGLYRAEIVLHDKDGNGDQRTVQQYGLYVLDDRLDEIGFKPLALSEAYETQEKAFTALLPYFMGSVVGMHVLIERFDGDRDLPMKLVEISPHARILIAINDETSQIIKSGDRMNLQRMHLETRLIPS